MYDTAKLRFLPETTKFFREKVTYLYHFFVILPGNGTIYEEKGQIYGKAYRLNGTPATESDKGIIIQTTTSRRPAMRMP